MVLLQKKNPTSLDAPPQGWCKMHAFRTGPSSSQDVGDNLLDFIGIRPLNSRVILLKGHS